MPGVSSFPPPTVFVVDDDDSVRKSIQYLLEGHGLPVATFRTGREFLEAFRTDMSGCLVVDFRMPGMTGAEVQEQLVARGSDLPVLMMTGYGNVNLCSRVMRAGAVDFLEKPVEDRDLLLGRVREALDRDRKHREIREMVASVGERVSLLTQRENDVMRRLVDGLSMKEIANEFETSFQTIAKHRQRVLEKLQVENDVALVRMMLEYRRHAPATSAHATASLKTESSTR